MCLLVLFCNVCFAQTDTIIVKQGDRLTGELLSVDGNVLLFKTAYSPDAVLVKWRDVAFLKASERFKVLTNQGKVYVGSLLLDTLNHSPILIVIDGNNKINLTISEIQGILRFDKRLSDRFKIGADLGVIVTKANHSDQATLGPYGQILYYSLGFRT